MRIRTIKPDFFLHEAIYQAEVDFSLPLRISFAGLWCAADREGRFKWEARKLGIQILPYDGLDFSRVLDALATRGFIRKYRVGDAWFGVIPSFPRHQIINNRERDSDLPNPIDYEQFDACITRASRDDHASKEEGKGRERNGREGEQTRCERGVSFSGPFMEEEVAMPAGARRLSATRKSQTKVLENTPLMIRIGSWFSRRETTLWTVEELESLLAIKPTPEEIDGMEIYYTDPSPRQLDARRGSLSTMLNNWNSTELDRARTFIASL